MAIKKKVQGLTKDDPRIDDSFVIDDTTNPIGFDHTPADDARTTKDHNTFPLSHSPEQLGEPSKTNPRTDRSTDKQGRVRDGTIRPRNNRIFSRDD